MGGQWPTWTVQTLVANNTVPIARTTQRTTVQDTAKSVAQKLDLQKLANCEPRPGRCSPLTHSVTYTRRPSNSAALDKQWLKHTSTRRCTTLSLEPGGYSQESSLQMASCREATYEGAEKESSADYSAALWNAQRNATRRIPCNAVVKSSPYSSSFLS